MVLSDRTIENYLRNGFLRIAPMEWGQLQPASVDLRLGDTYVVPDVGPDVHQIPPEGLALYPTTFILCSTVEFVRLPVSLMGLVLGKSSIARQGLTVEAAGLVDPGFRGQITLEIFKAGQGAFLLKPGMKICQIAFHELDRRAERPYGSPGLGSRYQGQEGPTSAREQPREET